VYHLYIPVVVKKVLDFSFTAKILHGTDYYAGNYANLTSQVIASHGEAVTAYLSFTYYRANEEWQTAIDNGENLLWSYDKYINIGATALPKGTRLTLVDVGDDAKAYTLTVGSNTLESKTNGYILNLNQFTSITDHSSWSKENRYICDDLGLAAVESEAGTYVKLSSQHGSVPAGATIRVGSDYYRPAVETDEGTKYKITSNVTATGTLNDKETNVVSDNYYLTIETLSSETDIINNVIEFSDSSMSGGNLPSKKAEIRDANDSANRYILYTFFDQSMTVVTSTTPEEINEENNTVEMTLKTEIQFKDSDKKAIFSSYSHNLKMYQNFTLELKEVDKSGNETENRDFVTGLYYQVENTDPVLLDTSSVTLTIGYDADDLITKVKSADTFTIEKTVKLIAKTNDVIYNQFPERSGADDKNGIRVYAKSNLSYYEETLDTTPMTTGFRSDGNNHSYYRSQSSLSTLEYNAYDADVEDGKESSSQLGINANDLDSNANEVSISSAALYDISSLTNLDSAYRIKLELELYQKGTDGTYSQVNAKDYLDDIKCYLGSRDSSENGLSKSESDKTIVMDETWENIIEKYKIDTDLPIEIYLDFKVKTGTELEDLSGTYANYKVVLKASLLDKDGNLLEGSNANDYIVYTNAKVYTQIIP
jgi:hypothetical protein